MPQCHPHHPHHPQSQINQAKLRPNIQLLLVDIQDLTHCHPEDRYLHRFHQLRIERYRPRNSTSAHRQKSLLKGIHTLRMGTFNVLSVFKNMLIHSSLEYFHKGSPWRVITSKASTNNRLAHSILPFPQGQCHITIHLANTNMHHLHLTRIPLHHHNMLTTLHHNLTTLHLRPTSSKHPHRNLYQSTS